MATSTRRRPSRPSQPFEGAPMKYSLKLKDPRWQRRRLEVFNRDKFTCLCCGAKDKTLNVHHLFYCGNPWDAPMEHLETLCEPCHEKRSELNKLFHGLSTRSAIQVDLSGKESFPSNFSDRSKSLVCPSCKVIGCQHLINTRSDGQNKLFYFGCDACDRMHILRMDFDNGETFFRWKYTGAAFSKSEEVIRGAKIKEERQAYLDEIDKEKEAERNRCISEEIGYKRGLRHTLINCHDMIKSNGDKKIIAKFFKDIFTDPIPSPSDEARNTVSNDWVK